MSYFNIDENTIATDEQIKYIYNGISVNNRDIKARTNDDNLNSIKKQNLPDIEGQLIPIKNSFYQISLRNKEPNFIYAGLSPSSYTAKSVYLFGLLHRNISGISSTYNSNVIGEIVVEHTNINKQLQKVYSCFLIKEIDSNITEENPQGDTTDNSLDKLVRMVNNSLQPEQTFELSSVIPEQTHSIHYVDEENHIFVFTNPIVVNKDTANLFKTKLATKTKLFSIYPTNENSNKTLFYGSETIVLKKNPKTGDKATSKEEGFRLLEGIDEDIWIDCSPTGVSDEELKSYQIPLNSEYSDHKHQIDGFKMITHFFIFILIMLLSFFMIPKLYKAIIIDQFNTNNLTKITGTNDRHRNIHSADRVIWIAFIIIILVAVFTTSLYYTMFMSAFAVAGFSIIQFSKTNIDYMTTIVDDKLVDSSYVKDANNNAAPFKPTGWLISDLGALFMVLGRALFTGDPKSWKLWLYLGIALACSFLIQGIVHSISKQLNKEEEIGFWDAFANSCTISFLMISPICILITAL